jgi:bilirubin oxidase
MKRLTAVLATAILAPWVQARAAALPGGSLNPISIPKYTDPLPIPPAMPTAGSSTTYDISARQLTQQVLPTGLPLTTVWGYGAANDPRSFSYPAFTLFAQQGSPTTVTWRNELVATTQNGTSYLPHLFTIDPTLHWANPPGPTDARPTFTATPAPYTGPVPLVTHLHGGHIAPESDGFPEAWFLPNSPDIQPCVAPNLPAGCFFTRGSNFANAPGAADVAGRATYVYANDQRATTLWFHDHALGMTRANVYAGLAGFYILRDGQEAGLNLPGPYGVHEIPLLIQDRSFNTDGSLFYPTSRVFFDGFAGPYLPSPGSDISPYWNPEFFGNTMVVNGKVWPKLQVEARKYRFRLLNGSDSRWLIVKFGTQSMKAAPVKLNVIGTDGGLITGAPAVLDQLPIAPGERYDVIVDFSAIKPGTRLILVNLGPDAPFGGSVTPGGASDPNTTGQIMAFDVVALPPGAVDTSVLPARLAPRPDPFLPATLPAPVKRTVTLTEFASLVNPAGPSEAQVGDASGPKPWSAPITEHVKQNTLEEWTIVNRTADAHPIHLHQTQFKVVSRTPIDLTAYDAAIAACQASPQAANCPPDPNLFVKKNAKVALPFAWEVGAQKDTLQTNPGEITKLQAYFDIQGLYVWHCHILSHEDNEMMRPLCVSADPAAPICNK